MGQHLSEDLVAGLRRQELPAEEVLRALRHIAECPECAALGRAEMSEDIDRVQKLLAAEAAEQPRTRSAWMWAAAAAIVIALLSMLFIGRNRSTPPDEIVRDSPPVITKAPVRVSEPPTAREWTELVNAALESGKLPFPGDLHALRGETETLRGESDGDAGPLRPAGVYVDMMRPELSWPETRGATYVVTIVEGDKEVARSPELRVPRWMPSRPLARGRTYVWQVEVSRDGTTEVLPPPSAPHARFRIVSGSDHDALAAARERHPDDHLLLAALSARAGLEAEAKEHLAKLAGSSDPRIQRLRSNTSR